MPLNSVLNPYVRAAEDLEIYKGMMEEIIQIHGVQIYYLPRTGVNTADLLGEDVLSKYKDAVPIEAYVLNVDGNEGEGDIITQFGVDIRDRMTILVSRHRWIQEKTQGLYTQTGQAIIPEQYANTNSVGIKTNYIPGDTYSDYLLPDRPMEGDLIWFPMTKKLFVISFVEHEKNFYPLGQLVSFQITCDLFDYSSEEISTGIPEIDNIENQFSTNVVDNAKALNTQSGDPLLTESGDVILTSDVIVDDIIKYANNQLIQDESDQITIFDELNPLLIDQRTY